MLANVITAYRSSVALYTFVKLGIPVWIGRKGVIALDELSVNCGVEAHRLLRLLDVMIELDIVHVEDTHYSLTACAENLADESSLETLWILCELGESYWSMWPHYPSSLRSQVPVSAFESRHNMPFFPFLNCNLELKSTFDKLMTKMTEALSTEIVGCITCDEHTEVVDVGGGEGCLMKKLHQAYNLKSATVLDIYPERRRVEDGIEYVDGDFLKEIVADKDIYILKSILHDWDDDSALKILKNCHLAMNKESTLFVIEIIKKRDCDKGKTLDLLMDALFLGKERFYYEYENLSQAAGFTIERTISTSLSQSIMIWRKE